MRPRRKSRSLLLLLLLLPAVLARGDTFSFSGDRMETVLAKGKEYTVLVGGARVSSENNIIQAERIELFGTDFPYIRCTDKVRIVNEEKGLELTSRELFYNRKSKFLQVSGNVVMTDKKNELVLKGDYLENWEERDDTLVQIGVRILKKDLVCRAEFARYLRKEERLELSGMPIVAWKGDEYRALKIFVDLKADTIRLEGGIQGKVTSVSEQKGEGE